MKILYIHRHPFDKITGGVAEYLHYLPIALKAQGVETISYTAGEKNASEISDPRYLANGMSAYSGPFLKPGIFSFARKLKPLFELCQKEKIDLIHAQGAYRSGYVAMQIYKNTGIPYLLTSHSDILTTNSKRIQQRHVQRRCREILRHSIASIHLTPLMAKASDEIYDTHERGFIIGNGIDLSEWKPFIGLPEKNYMLAIGRLEKGKGFNILIDAYAKLRAQGIKTSLVIAGDGIDKTALHNQVKERGLNLVTDFQDFTNVPEASVIFTGYIRGDAKKHLFTQSKFIFFATQPDGWEEAFSIVQIEAMAAGKAMIASDTAPTRYLETLGLQTLLVKPDDIDAWVSQTRRILDNTELRRQLGEANLENVQQFGWEPIAKQYKEAYQTCLNNHIM